MGDLLRLEEVGKIWPDGTVALASATLAVASGTIHAVLGENGAGKSTLMKLVVGLERPTEGRVLWPGGRPQVGMVHQHFSLVPSLTVAENVALGREPLRRGLLDLAAAQREVRELGSRYGLPLDPDARVAALSVAARQKAELIKALAGGRRPAHPRRAHGRPGAVRGRGALRAAPRHARGRAHHPARIPQAP